MSIFLSLRQTTSNHPSRLWHNQPQTYIMHLQPRIAVFQHCPRDVKLEASNSASVQYQTPRRSNIVDAAFTTERVKVSHVRKYARKSKTVQVLVILVCLSFWNHHYREFKYKSPQTNRILCKLLVCDASAVMYTWDVASWDILSSYSRAF